MTEQAEYKFDYDPSVSEFAISKVAYLNAHPEAPFEFIATGALVLDTKVPLEPRILLLQRAASDTNPNKWEPPGGAVDDEDSSILDGVARELWEETRFRAVRIGAHVGKPHLFTRSNGGKVCRFNFAVHVCLENGTALRAILDPNEHQQFVWATEREIRAKRASGIDLDFVRNEVEQTVLLAFQHAHSN